ncbi:conjugal transfer protein TrbL family protein [Kitasatospora arboriphila]|uniref:Uncharacterized protein n=1 Tax=Kitasatospora arboriphila TaxID=258052 RepID=A0ABP4DZR5_9ACTN
MTPRSRPAPFGGWLMAAVVAATAVALTVVLAAGAYADPQPAPAPGPTGGAPAVPVVPTAPEPSPGLTSAPPVTTPSRPLPVPSPSPGPAPPAEAPATDDGSDGGVAFWDIPGQVKKAITGWIADLLRPLVVPLVNAVVHALLTVPDVTALPKVRELWQKLRMLALGLYGLLVLAGGITVMGHGTVQQRHGARELLPRLVFGIAASSLSLTTCSMMLNLGNAVSWAIAGDAINADSAAAALVGMLLAQVNTATAPLYNLVFALVLLTLAWTLLVTALVRLAAVVVLTVAAPLMLACHGHPATDGIARMWWRAFTGCAATQIVQSIVFLVCMQVLLDPENTGVFGIPAAGSLVNLTVLCGTLYLLVKVPGWIRSVAANPARAITSGGSRSGGLYTLRKVAVGALGMPMGPYAFGAQFAGRLRTLRTARSAAGSGRPRAGGPVPPRRRPGAGGPAMPPPAGPSGNGPGPGRPGTGRPGGTGPRAGSGPGGTGGAARPGPTAPPSGGTGSTPNNPGTGASAAAYQWGRPRRHTPGNQVPAPAPPPRGITGSGPAPGAPPNPPGPPQPTGGLPGPLPPPPGPGSGPKPPPSPPPPPAVRPTSASNLRPARVNLPPPLPRPAVLRPPLDSGPPGPGPRRRRRRNP